MVNNTRKPVAVAEDAAAGVGGFRFSIVNSSVILIFLSGMVGMIMLRILRKDLYKCVPSSAFGFSVEGFWVSVLGFRS